MFEELGPVMARSIVGDSYNPDYRYELETADDGMHLHITNKKTGECNTIKLEDTAEESSHYDPLYDDERMDELRKRRRISARGLLFAACVACVVLALVSLATILILEGVRNGI